MPEAYERADALGIYLTGAASDGGEQRDPAASLGGYRAGWEVKGLSAIAIRNIPALVIENTTPANGEGTGQITINGDGDLVFTPPGGAAGDPVTIAAGERKFLEGADNAKGIRVFRSPDFAFSGIMEMQFREPMNGVLSMEDVPDAERIAGEQYYRAFAIYAHGPAPEGRLFSVTVSRGFAGPRQSVLEFGLELPGSGGTIQTIPDGKTAPAAVSFSETLAIGQIDPGDWVGVWVRKTFPASGAGAAREKVSARVDFTTET